MSETPTAENPFASVTWPESYPDACQSEDNGAPAVVTPPEPTPAEIAVSGAAMRKEWGGYPTLKEYREAQAKRASDAVSVAMQARLAPNGKYIPLGAVWSEQEQKIVPMQLVVKNLDDADEIPVTMSQIGLPKHIPTATEVLNRFAESWGPAIDKLDAKIDEDGPWGPFADEKTRRKLEANGKKLAQNLATVMRACNKADDEAHATGTEALVCADIAKRQRRGLAKYGTTVANNPLLLAQWIQHLYEELLDASVYAKRILTIMNHEPENETDSDRNADGVQPAGDPVVQRHRKPGAGRKAKPCPGCGATKSIGSTVKNGIPTRRCRQCGHVVQTYPHLANVKPPAEMA